MIRPTMPEDVVPLIELAVAAGMFPANETGVLDKMFADYFGGNMDDGHRCVTDEEEEPIGVAYYAPAPATDRVWYLLMIGVRPDYQGQGRGTALLKHVEIALSVRGQRVLLIETSALPSYARTRAFYAKCGYEEEARIRDYYTAGEGMVVFRKVLNAS